MGTANLAKEGASEGMQPQELAGLYLLWDQPGISQGSVLLGGGRFTRPQEELSEQIHTHTQR